MGTPSATPPTPAEVLACLRTLEQLHALDDAALGSVPGAGAVLAAGYSLARRAGRARRDPRWRRPGAPPDEAAVVAPGRRPFRTPDDALRLVPDSAALRAWEAHEAPDESASEPSPRARRCYMCSAPFAGEPSAPPRCPACDALMAHKRAQRADLRGRVALVTGARVRIGYAVARSLLRAGAEVIATTRFAGDALARYAREPDFDAWSARLRLRELDLSDLPAVERFARELRERNAPLDVLVNNAARTIDHPPAWLAAMRALDQAAWRALAAAGLAPHALATAGADVAALQALPAALDDVGQPADPRPRNAWRARVGEVPLAELCAVHAANALAPFVLLDRLRPLLVRGDGRARFVVNVSSAEGRFYRRYKGPWHPHTNMAKAALNMLTRTCAEDLAREGVYVTAVDPGWVSEQSAAPWAARVREGGVLRAPVDPDDAAARVLDPVFSALGGAPPYSGVLLEHFRPAAW